MNPTIDTYDRIAGEFARHTWDIHLDVMLDTFSRRLSSHGTVLDLGCGPGRDVQLLRQRGLQVVGLDLSTGMLSEAQRRGVSPAGFVCADMRALPVVAGTFDGIWASASLLHVEPTDAPVALAEMGRVLRSGGCLYVGVKLGQGVAWDTRLGRRFFTYYQPDELAELLNRAGFGIVELDVDEVDTTTWINVIAVVR